MGKFIYSVRDLFSMDKKNGCLGLTGTCGYYVAEYQRGYKWQADSNDWNSPKQVNTLLRDIDDAMEKNDESKYYLQFISVKRVSVLDNGKARMRLEVIDGQQRLTTLSILISVFKELYACWGKDLFQEHRLGAEMKSCAIDYAVSETSRKTLNGFFDDKVDSLESHDDQTAHFMVAARESVRSLLEEKFRNDEVAIRKYVSYLLDHVMVIVNLVQDSVGSEDVFENLNSRKVPLDDTELIKGLLLCHAARAFQGLSYQEILERRSIMGRTWDDVARWFSHKEVGVFFFGEEDFALYDFLLLVALRWNECRERNIDGTTCYNARVEGRGEGFRHYRLFNEFYLGIRDERAALAVFNEVEDVYWLMRDIYDDVERYNAFGFVLFRQSGFGRIKTLKDMLTYGKGWRENVFPLVSQAVSAQARSRKSQTGEGFCRSYQFGYKNNPEELRRDLLLLNCFAVGKNDKNEDIIRANGKRKFSFYSVRFEATKSLEHVQPQNPKSAEGLEKLLKEGDRNVLDFVLTLRTARKIVSDNLTYTAHSQNIKAFIDSDKNKELKEVVVAFENESGESLGPNDKTSIADFYAGLTAAHNQYFEELKLKDIDPSLCCENPDAQPSCKDSIGNIVLITGSMNASFSDRSFASKRVCLRGWVNEGENVPPHTYNVFSKISGEGTSLDCWCVEDVAKNARTVLRQLWELISKLSEEAWR